MCSLFFFKFFSKTPHKELTVCIQFPDEYPNEPLIVELKTKVLAYKLMTGLTDVVEKEAKKYLGNRQVEQNLYVYTKISVTYWSILLTNTMHVIIINKWEFD